MVRNKTTGAALITALLVVTLVAGLAVTLMTVVQYGTFQTGQIVADEQMQLYADGVTQWGIGVLQQNLLNDKKNQLVDKLPLTFKTTQPGGYQITGTLNDLQSRFNLNSLINPAAYAKFIHLLQAVAPEVSAKQAEQIAVALNEWLLPISGTSANDESYARHRPPYRAAHRFMTSISELRLVAGVTPIIYQRLLPYVAAYPDSDTAAINVNTASLPVLLTLSPSMTVAEAEEIIARRKQQPFTDTATFLALPAIAKYNITGDDVVVTSTFFMVVATVAQGQQSLTMYTLLQRLVMAQTIQAKIIWQTQNTE